MLFAFLLMLQAAGDPALPPRSLDAPTRAAGSVSRDTVSRDGRSGGPSAGSAETFGPAPVLVFRRPAPGIGALRSVERPAVTCAARSLEVPPKLDAQILGTAPQASLDPRIIGRISPCLP